MYCLKIFESAVYFFFVIFVLNWQSCRKKELETPVANSSLTIQTFVFEKKYNPQISTDIVLTIKDNTITGNVNKLFFTGIPTFTTNAATIEINGIKQKSGTSPVDLRQLIVYTLTSQSGETKQFTVKINWDDTLPSFNISTEGKVPITSPINFIKATLSINGKKIYADYNGNIQIRGRGNTTWSYPKKPYKIKLEKEASLLGLAPEKDWVLLANYIDGTHMLNAVGLKIGKLINMPYTNNVIPVEVTLNGAYQGLYMLTEQVEVKKSRINVGDDGQLFVMDANYNDEWQFKSAKYKLPVMIKHPEIKKATEIEPIKKQFEQLESLIADTHFPNNNYLQYFDGDALANYLIVQLLTDNEEINHPKSTYIYKTKTGKFTIGPVWDFDWAFAYEGAPTHFLSYNRPMFWAPPSVGTAFFSRFLSDPYIKTQLKLRWANFKTNKFEELLAYIDDYAYTIEAARNRDYTIWRKGNIDFKGDVKMLKTWLQNRANFVNTSIVNL
jgi:hypothetical protein